MAFTNGKTAMYIPSAKATAKGGSNKAHTSSGKLLGLQAGEIRCFPNVVLAPEAEMFR